MRSFIPRLLPDAFCEAPEFSRKWGRELEPFRTRIRAMIPEGKAFSRRQGKTRQRFTFEWMRYRQSPQETETFFQEVMVPLGFLKGKLVLAAGCGMGRFTRVAASEGCEVVALDLGDCVERTWQLTRGIGTVHVVQGDLLAPPFPDDSFDCIYSLGVLHHTPAPQEAFAKVTGLLRQEGTLSFWVYGKTGSFPDYQAGFFRKGREMPSGILRLLWNLLRIREINSELLRKLTVRMPCELLYFLCASAAVTGRFPPLNALAPVSLDRDWRVRWSDTFDWYAAPYQSHHGRREVEEWIKAAGLRIEKQLPHGLVPKIGYRTKKDQASVT